MANLSVSRFVLRAVLNHKDSEVTTVYDRHSYDAEKRAALKKWAKFLKRIIAAR